MRYLIVIFFIVFATTVHATPPVDTAPDIAPIEGAGNFSCGQFIEYRMQNNPQQLDMIVQWVWGFLSAYNIRGNFGEKWQRLSHIYSMPDSPTVLLALEAYCRKYPYDTLLDGTFNLIKESHGSAVWKQR